VQDRWHTAGSKTSHPADDSKVPVPRCGAPKRSTGGADGLGARLVPGWMAPVSFPKLGLNSAPSHIFPPFPSISLHTSASSTSKKRVSQPVFITLVQRFVQQNPATKSASHPREMPPEAVEARPLPLW
jgi:hypothetical protein